MQKKQTKKEAGREEAVDGLMASRGPPWQTHRPGTERQQLLPFISSNDSALRPAGRAHPNGGAPATKEISLSKSFNCLINACKAMQIKPIVDEGARRTSTL